MISFKRRSRTRAIRSNCWPYLAAILLALAQILAPSPSSGGTPPDLVNWTKPPGRDLDGRPYERPRKTWSDHRFTGSDGTVFHYMQQGHGIPVILLHGMSGSAMDWFYIGAAQQLSKTNLVIVPDLRGHGLTGPSPPDSQGNMVDDVLELLDHLRISKAHIVGYSMGGATAVGLLKKAPERFLTAALMGIGVVESPEWQRAMPSDPTPPPGEGTPPIPPDLKLPVGFPRPEQSVDLSEISFPVLAIDGAYDFPVTKTHRMWRQLSNFTHVVIPKRNHNQAFRDPRLVQELVRFVVSHNSVTVELASALSKGAAPYVTLAFAASSDGRGSL